METRRQDRCEYHIVWIPRYRYKVLIRGVKEFLAIKLVEIRKNYPEIEYREWSIEEDHVHVIVSFPPRMSISKVVQIIKSNTGKALKGKFKYLRERYYRSGGIWSSGYFVSTIGLDERIIKKYVRYQAKEDLGQAKLEM